MFNSADFAFYLLAVPGKQHSILIEPHTQKELDFVKWVFESASIPLVHIPHLSIYTFVPSLYHVSATFCWQPSRLCSLSRSNHLLPSVSLTSTCLPTVLLEIKERESKPIAGSQPRRCWTSCILFTMCPHGQRRDRGWRVRTGWSV